MSIVLEKAKSLITLKRILKLFLKLFLQIIGLRLVLENVWRYCDKLFALFVFLLLYTFAIAFRHNYSRFSL